MHCINGSPETDWQAKPQVSTPQVDSIPTQRKRIAVAAAAFVQDGKLLAAERGYGKWQGWWEFPGGKMEMGEDPETALRREIREEMDTDIAQCRYHSTIEYDYDEFHMTMHLFICLMQGEYKLKEHTNAIWLDQHELKNVKWLPADIELITRWQQEGIPQI